MENELTEIYFINNNIRNGKKKEEKKDMRTNV